MSAPKNPDSQGGLVPGFVPHAYDYDGAKKLWDISLKLAGLPKAVA